MGDSTQTPDDSDDNPDVYDVMGPVVSSEYRHKALHALAERGPSTPTVIAEDIGLTVTHTSRAVGTLREHDFVELLVPEDRKKGRVYDTTNLGEDVCEAVNDINGTPELTNPDDED